MIAILFVSTLTLLSKFDKVYPTNNINRFNQTKCPISLRFLETQVILKPKTQIYLELVYFGQLIWPRNHLIVKIGQKSCDELIMSNETNNISTIKLKCVLFKPYSGYYRGRLTLKSPEKVNCRFKIKSRNIIKIDDLIRIRKKRLVTKREITTKAKSTTEEGTKSERNSSSANGTNNDYMPLTPSQSKVGSKESSPFWIIVPIGAGAAFILFASPSFSKSHSTPIEPSGNPDQADFGGTSNGAPEGETLGTGTTTPMSGQESPMPTNDAASFGKAKVAPSPSVTSASIGKGKLGPVASTTSTSSASGKGKASKTVPSTTALGKAKSGKFGKNALKTVSTPKIMGKAKAGKTTG